MAKEVRVLGLGQTLIERPADELLAEFTLTGSQSAFEEVVRRYAGMVYSACMRVTKDAHDAEDVTQAVFLTLAVQCKTEKGVKRPGPWLKQVAQRASLDLIRSRSRREKRERKHGEESSRNGNHVPIDREVDLEELNHIVSEELARLPAKYRMPLVSLYFGGMSREEIAQEMGLKPGTLAVRIQRGRLALAKRLKERGAAPDGLLLGAIVAQGICSAGHEALVARTAEAAAKLALGRDLASSVSSHVLALVQGAAAAVSAAKVKAVLVIVLLSAGVAFSSAGAVYEAAVGRPPPRWLDLFRLLNDLHLPGGLPRFENHIGPLPTPLAQAGDSGASVTIQPAADIGRTRLASAPRVSALADPPRLLAARSEPTQPAEPPRAAAVAATASAVPAVAQQRTESAPTTSPLDVLTQPLTGDSAIAMSGDVRFDSVAALLPRLGNLDGGAPVPIGATSLSIGGTPGGFGSYSLRSGVLSAAVQDIGARGTGELVQTGGVNNAVQVRLGMEPGGRGTYRLLGGQLVTAPTPLAPSVPSGIVIGGKGEGTFLLGDAASSGTVIQSGGQLEAAYVAETLLSGLTIRADNTGQGTLHGWGGIIGVNKTFVQNGRVIADGFGQERSLLFVGYPTVTNTIENQPDGGDSGWFARNKGQLILPPIALQPGTHAYSWGEGAQDDSPDLVNSVRLTLHDVQRADKLNIHLLSIDRADIPALPAGHHFVGVWSYDDNLAAPAGVDLTVRYDDGLAAELGLRESNLKLWIYDGKWELIDGGAYIRNLDLHTLSGHSDAPFTFFAVSAPEPGSGVLLLTGAAMLLGRRRRRTVG